MNKVIILLSLFLSTANAGTKRIAIIDTGLNLKDPRFSSLICGSKDFTGTGIQDTNRHGTHIAGLIKQYAENRDYCFLIYKFYDEKASPEQNSQRVTLALQEAILNKADIVNFSGGGETPVMEEYYLLKNSPNILYIVAAGNKNKDIYTANGVFFPASYVLDNVIPVGALNRQGTKLQSSNWGRNVVWELGESVESATPCKTEEQKFNCTMKMSGSSMATAIHTGKYINKYYETIKKSR